MLGYSFKSYFYDSYIAPLIESGQLKITEPLFPRSHTNRYIAAEYAPPIASVAEILEYLKEPHDKGEIARHFGLTEVQVYDHMRSVIADGRVIKIEADLEISKRPRFVTAEAWAEVVDDEKVITGMERKVIDYLKTHGKIDRAQMETLIGRGYLGTKRLVVKMMSCGLITGESISNVQSGERSETAEHASQLKNGSRIVAVAQKIIDGVTVIFCKLNYVCVSRHYAFAQAFVRLV